MENIFLIILSILLITELIIIEQIIININNFRVPSKIKYNIINNIFKILV